MRLARFTRLKSNDAEFSFHSVKQRNPNVHSFEIEKNDLPNWQTITALFELPNSTITSSQLSGYAISGGTYQRLRISVPLNRGYRLQFGSRSLNAITGQAFLYPQQDFRTDFAGGYSGLLYDCSRKAVETAILTLNSNFQMDSIADGAFSKMQPNLNQFRISLLNIVEIVETSHHQIISQKSFTKACEDLLILAIASSLLDYGDKSPPKNASILVRKAREYIHANIGDPISVSEIATATGSDIRSLRAAFKNELGMTIQGELISIRLNYARSLLLGATSSESVTNIALAAGFNHLGDFSIAYNQRFGERPSETLRRVQKK